MVAQAAEKASMIEEALTWVVDVIEMLGYFGIFVATFLESTFVPLPSEVTVIPVGFLVSQGKMHLGLAYLASFAGTMAGSLFSYWVAVKWGRTLLVRYGKYFFMDEDKLRGVENYFASHGPISIFTGRLIPGIRHFISFPAGLAKMSLKSFVIYTAMGGGMWMAVLLLAGYLIGNNKEMLHEYMPIISWSVFGSAIALIVLYVWRQKRKTLS